MSASISAQPKAERSRWRVPSDRERGLCLVVLAALALTFIGAGLVQAARDAPTVDEAIQVAAGTAAVEYRDLRMNPEHGLLHRVVPAVLPSLLADPLVPRTQSYDDGDWFDYTADFILANDRSGRLDAVLFWFRVGPVLVGAATGALLYALGARLLGRISGLVTATLWLTTPYVLGLAHLSALDASFSFAVVLVALAIDRYRQRPGRRALAVLAASLGTALLVRHTALVLVPVVAAVVVFAGRRDGRVRLIAQVAGVLLGAIGVVWLAYRTVDPTPVAGPPRERFEGLIAAANDAGVLEQLALAAPMPVEWRAGLAHLVVTSEERPAYLLGEWTQGSRLLYLPLSALVKLPPTFLLALLAGVFGWWAAPSRVRMRATIAAVLPAAAITTFLLLQPLNLGLRLALPVVALAALLAGGIPRLERRWSFPLFGILTVGQLVAFASAHPASLAWSPYPFSDGYRYVSDSSIDIGQANRAVRREHAEEPFVAVSLFSPRGYDVVSDVPSVVETAPTDLVGRIAVSATNLTTLKHEQLSWLRAYCPVEVIDGAVLVYRFDAPPSTMPGPVMPKAPCTEQQVSAR